MRLTLLPGWRPGGLLLVGALGGAVLGGAALPLAGKYLGGATCSGIGAPMGAARQVSG